MSWPRELRATQLKSHLKAGGGGGSWQIGATILAKKIKSKRDRKRERERGGVTRKIIPSC